MADYKFTDGETIVRTSDGVSFLARPHVPEYQEFCAWMVAGGVPDPAPVTRILSQDLMAQFTAEDAAKIQTVVASNPQFWLLWSALQAQSEPMATTSQRFVAGWSTLVTVLGQVRMNQIAVSLGANSLVG